MRLPASGQKLHAEKRNKNGQTTPNKKTPSGRPANEPRRALGRPIRRRAAYALLHAELPESSPCVFANSIDWSVCRHKMRPPASGLSGGGASIGHSSTAVKVQGHLARQLGNFSSTFRLRRQASQKRRPIPKAKRTDHKITSHPEHASQASLANKWAFLSESV